MFLCRVVLGVHCRTQNGETCIDDTRGTPDGKLWATRHHRELASINGAEGATPYHSLLAETSPFQAGLRHRGVLRFREFVVFHGDTRVYPEYLLAYSRGTTTRY